MLERRPADQAAHQRFRALRQNRGISRPFHGGTMRDRVPSPRAGRVAAVCLLVVGVLAINVSALPHVGSSSSSATGPAFGESVSASSQSWNNGRIALSFAGPYPSFTVSSLSNSMASANQTLTGLAELNTTDFIVSFASFSAPGVVWSVSSSATAQVTEITLSGRVPVISSGGEWESGDDSGGGNTTIGAANVTIVFGLNASTSPNPWSVSYTLNVSGWPWIHASDSVGVEVRSNVTAPSAYWAAGGANQLTELSRTDQRALATFTWGALAQARYSGGTVEDSSVGTYSNLSAGGSSYLVRLEFGSVTGGYSSLSYDPWLAILPSSSSLGKLAAWVLSPTSLAIIAGGGAASLVLAVLARARRTPPETGL
jgi:hypothetical protein